MDQDISYEDAWSEGEDARPLSEAVDKARQAAANEDRDEFAAAFNETDDDGKPVERPARPGADTEQEGQA